MTPRAEIGVFGGSGFYAFLEDPEEVLVETPFGAPSAPYMIGTVAGRRVAFLPRHGRDHEFPPHKVPYRANVWGMKELGVTRLFGPSAAGSLRRDIPPRTFVISDQAIDQTKGRTTTFHDGPTTTHVSFADPYCPTLRTTLVSSAAELGIDHRDGGTMLVIEGPRFSTRAESKMFAQMGGDVIGMTQFPEVSLAREVEICFANVALVTDYDVGVDDIAPVSHQEVLKVFGENIVSLRDLLFAAIPLVPADRDCPCATALSGSS
ncbi:MAG TPA: S-methyl-5'-thioadenosine phosphorylase [Actinomycetota bacterium]|nr:S-methyl-5'-thioadenosine phosphorylase [Actinomycetota bacterium]